MPDSKYIYTGICLFIWFTVRGLQVPRSAWEASGDKHMYIYIYMSQSNRNWVLSARYAENQAHRELGSVRYQHKPSEYKQECTVRKKL